MARVFFGYRLRFLVDGSANEVRVREGSGISQAGIPPVLFKVEIQQFFLLIAKKQLTLF